MSSINTPITSIVNKQIKLVVIDLFCGAGGMTEGIEKATDDKGNKIAKVIACINHDDLAIQSHKANHSDCLHFVEDIRKTNLEELNNKVKEIRRRYPNAKLKLHASLECTHFSNAKGGDSRDEDSRSLAIYLYDYIDVLQPDIISIENVREFMSWGEMGQRTRTKQGKTEYQIILNRRKSWHQLPYKGNEALYEQEEIKPALYPIHKKKGLYYMNWVENIKKRGYDFDFRILNCADFGAYTSRIRYFAFFIKKDCGWKIDFPKPTHAKSPEKHDAGGMFDGVSDKLNLKKWKPVRDVLELDNEGNSIFQRKKALSERTLERIYAGLLKYVGGGNKLVDAFISKYYSGSPMSKNVSIEEPAHTITTHDHHSLIQPCWLVKFLSNNAKTGINKGASIENPSPTITTQARIAIAHCNFLSTYYKNGSNYSTDNPAPTVTTKDRICKVTVKPMDKAWLDKQYGSGEHNHQSINEPSGAITTTPKLNLVSSQFLMNPQFKNNGSSIEDPCFTLIARMDKKPPYLISTEEGIGIEIYDTDSDTTKKIKAFMAMYGIYDIKMRMLNVNELKSITGFPKDYILKGNQAHQKKFIGNAVPVLMAQRLTEHLIKINS